MMDKGQEGDVVIETLTIHTSKGAINLASSLLFCNIYESILLPGSYAEFVLRDDGNIATILPLLGEEKVVLEFMTPGRKSSRYEFVAMRIQDSVTATTLKSKVYNLVCAPIEVHNSRYLTVSKAYTTNISEIVSDICKSYLKTNRSLDVEQTKGVQEVGYWWPHNKPYAAIDFIRRRAVSADNRSSTYLFFENQKGLNFKTIEKLFSEMQVGDRTFTNDSTVQSNFFKSNFRNIIAYNLPKQFDTTHKVLNVETSKFDISTLEYKTDKKKFSPGNFKAADSGSMKETNTSKWKGKYDKTPGEKRVVPFDGYKPDTFIPDMTPDQISYISQIASGSLHLHVYGDSSMTVGQGLEAKLTEVLKSSEIAGDDKYLSGKYLIMNLRHIIRPQGAKPRYTCAIEGIKGDFKESV